MRRLAALVALTVAACVPARAVVVIAVPSNELIEYFATPYAVTKAGGPLYLAVADGVPHSVWSYAFRPDGSAEWCGYFDPGRCPLFWSPSVSQSVGEVLGLQDATGGGTEYPFFCGVHQWMHGTLIVE